uniref:Uncharacterized protein n=1 Tax=Amphimedon queenslandica TaxID=400682 RepID=A0A1X7T735_AMPQE
MPYLRSKTSAKKLRKLMKERQARPKAEISDCSLNEKLDIPESVSCTIESSGSIHNKGLCDGGTELGVVASGSVCDHNPELCDATEFVVSSVANDATDPFVLSDLLECNVRSVCNHNLELCDTTQFELVITPEDMRETLTVKREVNDKLLQK